MAKIFMFQQSLSCSRWGSLTQTCRISAYPSVGIRSFIRSSPGFGRIRPTTRRHVSSKAKLPLSKLTKILLVITPVNLILGYWAYDQITSPEPVHPINPWIFTPYTITSVAPLSPTSSVITLSPKQRIKTPPSFWHTINDAGIWNVQVKQPQLQIQREYTPIPSDAGLKRNEIRLFVRAVAKGEVSNYLLNQNVGDVVELRGPVFSYSWKSEKISELYDTVQNVLFIAGGTGVSPALQVAQYLKRHNGTEKKTLTLLYASRSSTETVLPDVELLKVLEDARFKVEVQYFYDDKESFIQKDVVERAVAKLEAANSQGVRNAVIMVSGPEGFINHFAGKKVWKDGIETQGQLGGILGEILKKREQGRPIDVMKL